MSTLRATSSISTATLASRGLGLVRDSMMTHVFGTSWVMGTFTLAWMLPNLLRRLFGEGALSAAFVPAFTRSLAEDRDAASRLLARVVGVLLVGLGLVTAAVIAGCLLLPPHLLGLEGGPGVSAEERGGLLLRLTAVLFPYVVPVCIAATMAGALNAVGVFALPASSPALLNLFWIGGLLVAPLAAGGSDEGAAMVVAVALLAGGVAQVLLNAMPLRRRGLLPRPAWPAAGDPSRRVFAAMAPTVLGLSLVQANVLVDQTLAEYLVGPGANTHVYLANRLLLFPHALTAVAAATAVFPALAQLAHRGEHGALGDKLARTLHGTWIVSLPAAIGLIAIAPDLLDVVFVHGEYTSADAGRTALTTAGLVAGLPFVSSAQIQARALYALGDHAGPAGIAGVLVLVNLALNLLFVLGLGTGTEGLTAATSITAALNAAMLRRRLHRLLPATARFDWRTMARMLLAAAAMLLLVRGMAAATDPEGRAAKAILRLALPIPLGAAAYFAVHAALGGRELTAALRHLRRRRAP